MSKTGNRFERPNWRKEMRSPFRGLFGRSTHLQEQQARRKRAARQQSRFFLEDLEGRMLLNSHPIGETPHHIHADLSIFVNGQNFIIPPGVNFPQSHAPEFPNVPSTVPLGVNGQDENAHTHTDDGILHLDEGTQTGTGTLSNTAGSTSVVGTGTSFTTQLHVGDFLTFGTTPNQITDQIVSITDNTHLTVRDAITAANTNVAFNFSFFVDLNQFFTNWGGIFNQNELKLPTAYGSDGHPTAFSDNLVDATHTIQLFVNGAPSSDFQNYEPEDGDQIVISYEAIPAANAPTLNPIHNVTMASNPGASAPARTFYLPLDGSDPAASALTYTASVSPSGSPL